LRRTCCDQCYCAPEGGHDRADDSASAWVIPRRLVVGLVLPARSEAAREVDSVLVRQVRLTAASLTGWDRNRSIRPANSTKPAVVTEHWRAATRRTDPPPRASVHAARGTRCVRCLSRRATRGAYARRTPHAFTHGSVGLVVFAGVVEPAVMVQLASLVPGAAGGAAVSSGRNRVPARYWIRAVSGRRVPSLSGSSHRH